MRLYLFKTVMSQFANQKNNQRVLSKFMCYMLYTIYILFYIYICIVCILPLSHSLVAHEAGQTILRRHQELGTALRRLLTGIGAESTEFTPEKRRGSNPWGDPLGMGQN